MDELIARICKGPIGMTGCSGITGYIDTSRMFSIIVEMHEDNRKLKYDLSKRDDVILYV